MRTIAVVLGDNDFGSTFKPLMESIYRALQRKADLSREAVALMIREGIRFHYVAFQMRHGRSSAGDSSLERTVEYLSRARVLFDEDAEADILVSDHDSGAWYLEVATGIVYAY